MKKTTPPAPLDSLEQPDTLITPATLDAGEDFARLDDILACQDIPEVTIRVPWWRRKGKPMPIRVRGLDLDQQEQVRNAAARAVHEQDRARGVKQHWPTFVCMTLSLGMTAPGVTYDQAKRLAKKNAKACEQISDFIWLISSVAQDKIDAIVEELAELGNEPEPTGADAPAGEGELAS